MPQPHRGAPHALYRHYVVVVFVASGAMLAAVPTAILLGHLRVWWPGIAGALGGAGLAAVVSAFLPWSRLLEKQSGQLVLYVWSLIDIAAIVAAVASSGGQRSWFWVLLLLTTIFFSVGYPLAVQAALFGATLVGFVAACAAAGPVLNATLLWQMTVLLATYGLAGFPAWELRRETAEHERARDDADRLAAVVGEREAWWRSLIERSSDPIVVFDHQWRVTFASPASERLFEHRPDQLTTIDVDTLVHPDDRQSVRAAAGDALRSGRSSGVPARIRSAGGEWHHVELSFAVLPGSGGGVVANLHDVTERVSAEAALTYQAMHDPLTKLANRMAFYESLQTCLALARRAIRPLSVLVLDLEGFKEVNDNWGHATGDEVLVTIARRLTETLRHADVTARLGGDEFAAVLATGGDEQGALTAARRVLAAIGEPIVLRGRAYWLRASVGIACLPHGGLEAEELVQRADRAMYEAKRTGTGVAVYEPAMDSSTRNWGELLGELRHAVTAGQLTLHYQPKVDVASGRAVGVEALVRWEHPQRGLLPPGAFLPIAESSGLVREITTWALPTAIRQVSAWSAQGLDLSVAVNLSAHDLANEELLPQVVGWLAEAGMSASRLTLELTEATAVVDLERASGRLARFRELGVRISIDDFGSGYSSFSYLSLLPLDELKLDGGFLRSGLGADGFVLRSVVDIGHHLGLVVVAEAVETEAELQQVADCGVDVVQGYVYAKPAPPDELGSVLTARRWNRPAGRRTDPGRPADRGVATRS